MPPLRLLGATWYLADDDWVWPGVGLFLRWDVAIAVVYAVRLAIPWLPSLLFLFSATVGALALQGFAVVLDLLLSATSFRGALMDVDKRRCLPCILVLRVALIPVQVVASLAVGIAAIVELQWFTLPILVIVWVGLGRITSFVWAQFAGVGEQNVVLNFGTGLVGMTKLFIKDKEDRSDIDDLQGTVKDLLEEADLAATDLVAGVVLLGCKQKATRTGEAVPTIFDLDMGEDRWDSMDEAMLLSSKGGALPQAVPLSPDDKEAREAFDLLQRNLAFASVVYEEDEDAVEEKLKENKGHGDSRLVFFEPENDYKKPVYGVFIDAAMRRVVVSVRGTSDLDDVMSDICANSIEVSLEEFTPPRIGHRAKIKHEVRSAAVELRSALPLPQVPFRKDSPISRKDPDKGRVHQGMYEAAKHITAQLEEKGILRSLFSDDKTKATVPLRHWAPCRGFDLLVSGHSLGAGTGSLLAPFLRKSYPQTHAALFATVAVCSEDIAEIIQEGSVSMILGDDIVPRLTVRNLTLARDFILSLLARSLIKKAQISAIAYQIDWSKLGGAKDILARRPISSTASRLQTMVKKAGKPHERFFHGSRVVYFRVTGRTARGRLKQEEDSSWRAEWSCSSDFQEILASQACLRHHKLSSHKEAIDWIAHQEFKPTE